MSIKAFCKLLVTVLVLGYPLLMHWALPLRPAPWPEVLHVLPMLLPTLLNLWLAWLFGSTLQHGREPLIGTFARIERQQLLKIANADLPVDIARYTRNLTCIWTGLFVLMAIIATTLAVSGETAWWALFTGVISYVLVSILFVGEYLYRLRRFSGEQHATPWQLAWLLIKSGPIWMRRQ